MASTTVLALLLLSFLPTIFGNDLPVGTGACLDCTKNNILAYAQLPAGSKPAGIGSYFRFGEVVVDGTSGGFLGNRNYVYSYVSSSGPTGSGKAGHSITDNLVPASIVAGSPGDVLANINGPNHCCSKCANVSTCLYFAFYTVQHSETLFGNYAQKGGVAITAKGKPADGMSQFSFDTENLGHLPPGITTRCNLITKKFAAPSDYSFQPGGKSAAVLAANPKVIIGGTCNANAQDDPHLVGAQGTKFDFNGRLGQPFCLITDRNLHINVLLDGYSSEKGLRTWIKEVGLIWRHEGKVHTARMTARKGTQQERGPAGFLAALTVDGAPVAVPAAPGAAAAAVGGFVITYVGAEKKHIFDVDHFSVVAGEGLLEMDVRMRVAHPSLQSANDAQAHFNLGFEAIENSPSVHGVLGQTYRSTKDQAERAAHFQALAATLSGPLAADEASGRGFLDGETSDYISSAVTAADCKYTVFSEVAPRSAALLEPLISL